MNAQSLRLIAALFVGLILVYAGHNLAGLIDKRTQAQAKNTQSIYRFEQALQTLQDDAKRWDSTFMYLSEEDVPDLTSLHQRLELDRFLNLDKDRLSVRSVASVRASNGTPLPLAKVCIATDDEVVRVEGNHFNEILEGIMRLVQTRNDLTLGQIDVTFKRSGANGTVHANLSPFCLLIRTNSDHN